MTALVIAALVSAMAGIVAVATASEPATAKAPVLTEEGKKQARR